MTTRNNEKSISPISGISYDLPKTANDTEGLEEFLNKNSSKKIVVIQGLGFVGAAMAIVCANSKNEEFAVVGLDLPTIDSYWKIRSINDGIFPITAPDPKIGELYRNSIDKSLLYATHDKEVFKYADYIIVDINFDVQREINEDGLTQNYDVDFKHLNKAVRDFARRCKPEALILMESTIPPGTTKEIVLPIIEDCYLERGISVDNILLGHSYERVMPGKQYIDSIQNFYRVYSGINQASEIKAETFLKKVINTSEYPLTRMKSTTASEMSKVLENSYRAMNIAFIVEWSRFAEDAGVDLYEVINAIRVRPTHTNIMLPGIGVGGYCLTKDPLLASWSKQNIFDSQKLKFSESAIATNENMPNIAADILAKYFKNNLKDVSILLCGVAYTGNIGDTRYSPVETFYRRLRRFGASISLTDPYLSYWPELSLDVEKNLSNALENQFDCIVISTGHDVYKNSEIFLDRLLQLERGTAIFDTIGILPEEIITDLRKKNDVIIIGRGDE